MLKPFMFLNLWVKHPHFLNIVKESWVIDIVGDLFTEFQDNMKKVKRALAVWSKQTFGNIF